MQLYGTDPTYVGQAAEILCSEYGVAHIDLNFGCPVPKVTRKGGGGALPWKRGLLAESVAHKGPFGHRRDAQPLAREHMLGYAPAPDQESEHEDDDEPSHRRAEPDEAPAIRLRLDRDVLAFGAPNGQVAGGRILTSASRHQRFQVAYFHDCSRPQCCNRRASCGPKLVMD